VQTNFQNSFTGRVSHKFAVIITSHLTRVATVHYLLKYLWWRSSRSQTKWSELSCKT